MQRRMMWLGAGVAACLVAALLVPTGAATAETNTRVGAQLKLWLHNMFHHSFWQRIQVTPTSLRIIRYYLL